MTRITRAIRHFTMPAQAALRLAALAGAICLLGSATPDVTSTYQAAQGHWQYLRLPRRVEAHRQAAAEASGTPAAAASGDRAGGALEMPPVHVVDMREELKDGNRSIFSRALQAGLQAVLERKEQAILFLNRRGNGHACFLPGVRAHTGMPKMRSAAHFSHPAAGSFVPSLWLRA